MTARVLVVDDILSNVKLLEAKLTAEYFEVVSAFNGLECLARIEEAIPDIVLLDVMMPGMDGPATFSAMKNRGMDIPVVFMTARVRGAEVSQYLDMGAAGVIPKPFDPVSLANEVQQLWSASLVKPPGPA